ncbi:GspE/PulE family protein [Patescibacteria group bacterium]|nr:GspE/PulE family protein [Patescibacteria group bacterium]
MFQSKKDIEEELKNQKRDAEENDAKRRADKNKLPYLNLISNKVPTEIKAMELIPESDSKKALLAPFRIVNKVASVAVFDPELEETKKIIQKIKEKLDVSLYTVSMSSLNHAWSYYKYIVPDKEISGKVEIDESKLKELQQKIKSLEDLNKLLTDFDSPYLSQILEIILSGAIALGASDIHLEPAEENGILRLRIDGLLHNAYDKFNQITYKSIVTRIKLLSNLKINITNESQDGRFTIALSDRDIEIRTSIIPSDYGETVVLRLLDPLSLKVNLEELGWRPDDLEIVESEIKKPNGLILNTGPTGSGKTTTLYAFLRKVFKPEIKIITVEDPIEYHLAGISQTQIDQDAGYTFASGLRSILRQDPNIILVGEIRDKETAEIALNAALTGHLVFSTLHTNDAVGAIPRLMDLDVPSNILGPSLSLIIAQRLVRKLCSSCKKEKELDETTKNNIEKLLKRLPKRVDTSLYKNYKIWSAVGCDKCAGLGYKGRTSVFELFVVDEKIESAIYGNPTEIQLKDLARAQGMVTMQEDGLLKVLQGITSLDEIERLTGPLIWDIS